MKTIKIIDLLNKIANGEEVPKKIKTGNFIWNYNREANTYFMDNSIIELFYIEEITKKLNDEVKILDEKKIPEKLGCCKENTFSAKQNGMTKEDRRLLDSNFKEIGNKINEILDYLEKKYEKQDN